MSADCPALDSDVFSVTSHNVTGGAVVNVTCSDFGHRVVGERSLTCDAASKNWEPGVPSCEWTWEFTTHEKVVLGTAVGCAALVLVILVATLIACCCCRRRRAEKEDNDMMYSDNPGFTSSPADAGGVYPDAYFAYQDMHNKHDANGVSGSMDRAWLGYIPRPKVAEGIYYQ
ncbi:uncharacterized protein LOC143278088 [Babylonia areolata]|uniref:uncharacterized protein LOC143278088 n=1 Tax=Babylonia areolata TaxID=304850 RepID=UPI003FD023C7